MLKEEMEKERQRQLEEKAAESDEAKEIDGKSKKTSSVVKQKSIKSSQKSGLHTDKSASAEFSVRDNIIEKSKTNSKKLSTKQTSSCVSMETPSDDYTPNHGSTVDLNPKNVMINPDERDLRHYLRAYN